MELPQNTQKKFSRGFSLQEYGLISFISSHQDAKISKTFLVKLFNIDIRSLNKILKSLSQKNIIHYKNNQITLKSKNIWKLSSFQPQEYLLKKLLLHKTIFDDPAPSKSSSVNWINLFFPPASSSKSPSLASSFQKPLTSSSKTELQAYNHLPVYTFDNSIDSYQKSVQFKDSIEAIISCFNTLHQETYQFFMENKSCARKWISYQHFKEKNYSIPYFSDYSVLENVLSLKIVDQALATAIISLKFDFLKKDFEYFSFFILDNQYFTLINIFKNINIQQHITYLAQGKDPWYQFFKSTFTTSKPQKTFSNPVKSQFEKKLLLTDFDSLIDYKNRQFLLKQPLPASKQNGFFFHPKVVN